VAFPLLIPRSFIDKEKHHVEGFSPELAVVTIGGGEELAEPLVLRPTSETIIATCGRNGSSRTGPPRSNEPVEQRGALGIAHKTLSAHARILLAGGPHGACDSEEAEAETLQMLNTYTDFAVNDAAVPVIPGRKSEAEKFAGADTTYSLEAMMGDCKALQFCTSHFLDRILPRPSRSNISTRTGSCNIAGRRRGTLHTRHWRDYHGSRRRSGADSAPKLAPYQVVIVPIFKTDEEKASVVDTARKLKAELVKANIRVTLDEREGQSPGWKFNDWEMRGVPLRVELVLRTSPNKLRYSPAATARAGKGRSALRLPICQPQSNDYWRKFRRPFTTRHWRSARATLTMRKRTTS